MAFNYYKSQGREGLGSAYQLAMEGELAKAQAMSGVFDKLVQGFVQARQLKLARDQEERLAAQQADEKAYRAEAMGLDREKLGLEREKLRMERQQLQTEAAQGDAFTRAMAAINSMGGADPMGGGTPFQAPTLGMPGRERPMTAESLLMPMPQADPQAIMGMGPEYASTYLNQVNTLRDDAYRQNKLVEDRQASQAEIERYNATVNAMLKEGAISKAEAQGFISRGTKGGEDLSKKIAEHGRKVQAAEDFAAFRRESHKWFKENRPELYSEFKGVDATYDFDKGETADVMAAYRQDRQDILNRAAARAEAEAKKEGPFKYLAGDEEFKKGGFIEKASPQLKAKVAVQAMSMAAGQGQLRDMSLMLDSTKPDFAQLSSFIEKMDAAEKQTIKRYEDLIWATNGWVPNPPAPVEAKPVEPAPVGLESLSPEQQARIDDMLRRRDVDGAMNAWREMRGAKK